MLVYHGGRGDNLQEIIETGEYISGYNDNPWSGEEFDGLYVSNVREYAEQYGDAVIAIEVDENELEFIQECPIGPNDFGWRDEFATANEYMIPAGVKFKAWFVD